MKNVKEYIIKGDNNHGDSSGLTIEWLYQIIIKKALAHQNIVVQKDVIVNIFTSEFNLVKFRTLLCKVIIPSLNAPKFYE